MQSKSKAAEKRKEHMRPQVGKASIYADSFANRKMANGKPMNLNGDNAASKTLPLGTKAVVTNLQTGKSAVVTIEDRGPYVEGRIVDLSPATAEKIGLEKRQGIAPVEVRPIEIPKAVVASDDDDE
jgi:rare lipoprotein A